MSGLKNSGPPDRDKGLIMSTSNNSNIVLTIGCVGIFLLVLCCVVISLFSILFVAPIYVFGDKSLISEDSISYDKQDIIHTDENCHDGANDLSGRSDIDDKLNILRDEYDLCISFYNVPRSSFGPSMHSYEALEEDDLDDLEAVVDIFYEEFLKYDPDFVELTALEQIVFVKDSLVNGYGLSATPDHIHEVLYYDILLSDYDLYARSVIHHEYYHMIEEEINGDGYYYDPEWAALNEPGFKYGDGGYSCMGDSDVHEWFEGFVSGYSKCGLEEDKAEIFAALFTEEDTEHLIQEIAGGDIVLRKKAVYMIQFLKEHGQVLDIGL